MRPTLLATPQLRLSGGTRLTSIAACCALLLCTPALHAQKAALPPLLDTMTAELNRAMSSLGKQSDKQIPPYFLSYSVSDASYVGIRAQYGALVESTANRIRVADVQVRLGDPKLDNTHGTHRSSAVNCWSPLASNSPNRA